MTRTMRFSVAWLVGTALGLVAAPAMAGDSSDRSGTIGLELLELTPELREHLGGPVDEGALVARVRSGSFAEEAGIEVGDLIVGVDGWTVDSPRDVRRHMRWADEGERVAMELYRDGQRIETTIEAPETERRSSMHAVYDFDPDVSVQIGDVDIDFDLDDFERDMERLGRQMEQLGKRIGRQVEGVMDSVDWDEYDDRWERDLEASLEGLEGLDAVIEASLESSLSALESFDVTFDADELERDMESLGRELERLVEEIVESSGDREYSGRRRD